ncbi:MAG: CGNR zinc finger domain-containing protein [Alphaproteobacteria bacterium]|nr:CGNR zinc finger domain-containing protein [Alphaproteobacteria bacterium]
MREKLGIGAGPVNRYGGYMGETLRIATTELHGGHPALDFVNTLDWRDRPAAEGGPIEMLDSYAALLACWRRLDIIGTPTETVLAHRAAAKPAEAAAVLIEALELREALYRIAQAVRQGKTARLSDLDVLNRCLLRYPEGRVIAAVNGARLGWKAHGDGLELGSPLGAMARLGAELLVSAEPASIRCCAGPGCGWLFHDTSPNKRRRWCSMESCGNRAKARRHYQRHRV